MPTYSYKCNKCNKTYKIFQKMTDDPIESCSDIDRSNCEGILTRLISGGSGMIFKGSGFYLTDYVKDKQKNKKQVSKREKKKSNLSNKKKEESRKNEQSNNSK